MACMKNNHSLLKKNFPRSCPICKSSYESASFFLKENIEESKINTFSYASRKDPELMNYELSRCNKCDLIFTGYPPTQSNLSANYHEASFDSSIEAEDASDAYGFAFSDLFNSLKSKQNALEIGAGTGTFLEELKKQGFKNVKGIEPSLSAIEAAPKYRQEWIYPGAFDSSLLKNNSYELICCFMTLEHILDPLEIATQSHNLLNSGGAVAFVVHDSDSWINRLLGKKSPIIDIEHLQIFSKKSMLQLLKNSHFERIVIRSFKNKYRLSYWAKLLPLPDQYKKYLLKLLSFLGLSEIKVSINVGNLMAYGFKK